jgi:hypothetical protein
MCEAIVVEMIQMFHVTSSKLKFVFVRSAAHVFNCCGTHWSWWNGQPLLALVIDQVKLDVLTADQHNPKITGCSCHNKLDMAEKFENFELCLLC